MANKIILYTLTLLEGERPGSKRNGKIPTYIADGGYFPKANSNDSPADWDFIGATVDGSSEEGLGAFANQAAVKTYLDNYHHNNVAPHEHVHVEGTDDFDRIYAQDSITATNAAAFIWAKKID